MNNSSLHLLFFSTDTHLLVHLQPLAAADAIDHLVVNDDDGGNAGWICGKDDDDDKRDLSVDVGPQPLERRCCCIFLSLPTIPTISNCRPKNEIAKPSKIGKYE